jgi:hypothetical protein
MSNTPRFSVLIALSKLTVQGKIFDLKVRGGYKI